MMRSFQILLALLVLVAVASASGSVPRCPTVYDGATHGVFDMSTQFSTTSLSANWFGLENSDVLGYEWAIISDALATKAMQERDCRLSQGFLGNPDVQDWAKVRKQSEVTAKNLQLEATRTYYVVLRTTLSNGVQVFSNSNGLVVLPAELEQEFAEWSSKRSANMEVARDHIEETTGTCSLDEANRCNQAKENVHDFLEQIYGPATFADDSQLALLFRYPTTVPAALAIGVREEFAGQPVDDDDDDSDDDDDDGGALGGIIAGVIIGVIVLMLLCLLLLALLGFFIARGDDNDKFNERITERRQEDVDADFGTRTERVMESEATRVEFPDIDTHSRLSEAPM